MDLNVLARTCKIAYSSHYVFCNGFVRLTCHCRLLGRTYKVPLLCEGGVVSGSVLPELTNGHYTTE